MNQSRTWWTWRRAWMPIVSFAVWTAWIAWRIQPETSRDFSAEVTMPH